MNKKEYKHQHYLKNKEKYKQKAKEWIKNNPEKRKQIIARNNKKRAIMKRIWRENKTFEGNATLTNRDKCEKCGSTYRVGIHHRDGNNGKRNKPMNNNPNNLIVLCVRCHASVHGWWGIKII